MMDDDKYLFLAAIIAFLVLVVLIAIAPLVYKAAYGGSVCICRRCVIVKEKE